MQNSDILLIFHTPKSRD